MLLVINQIILAISDNIQNIIYFLFYTLIAMILLKFFFILFKKNFASQSILMFHGVNCINQICIFFLVSIFYFNPELSIELVYSFQIFSPLIFLLDGISISLICLTVFLFWLCYYFCFFSVWYRRKEFLLLLISIEFLLVFVFTLINVFYFYIAFEAILIPMFLIIGIWGSRQRRIHAAFQFFFYTSVGSFVMLLGLIYIYTKVGSFDWRVIRCFTFSFTEEKLLWLSFFLAFAVKVPLFPFHIWLPEAHVEAPTIGSVILAGILLKMGTYGLYRFVLVLFTKASLFFTPAVQLLCILGLVYTSLTTIRQIDLKKIIAYSSVGHMSYVVLGLFSFNTLGIAGSFILMIGHGFISAALFFLIGFIYYRFNTRLIPLLGGLRSISYFAWFFLFFTLGNVSFPGTINFIGEFLCITGSFLENWFVGLVATISIVLTAAYSFWLFNRLCYSQVRWVSEGVVLGFVPQFRLLFLERQILACLVFMSLLFGLCPNLLLDLLVPTLSLNVWI